MQASRTSVMTLGIVRMRSSARRRGGRAGRARGRGSSMLAAQGRPAELTIRPMATLFTRIIDGEIPGRFVWRDDRCVAFLTDRPAPPGHMLVVPVEEVDHWVDLDPDLAAHLIDVAQARSAGPSRLRSRRARVGLIIAGLEVPHCHLHLIPIGVRGRPRLRQADHDPDPAALDDAAERLRAALRDQRPRRRALAAARRRLS